MYPSFWRIWASAIFCLDEGMRTSSCIAVFALRTRVSMSAMGSVSMLSVSSPARLRQTGDLAGVRELAQAHTAEAELAEHRAGTPAATTAGVGADLELRLAGSLVDECFLGHVRLRLTSSWRACRHGTDRGC